MIPPNSSFNLDLKFSLNIWIDMELNSSFDLFLE